MTKKRIGFILGVAIIVGAVFFVLSDSKSTLWGGEADFAIRDTAQVVKVFMADKDGGKVLLERDDNTSPWHLNTTMKGHPKIVKMLLGTLHDLEIKYPVSKKAHNSVVKDLAAAGIKVEVYTRAYRIHIGGLQLLPYLRQERVFYVGAATADNMGTFMIMEGSEHPYVVDIPGFRGFVAARFTTDPQDWLSHEVLHIPYGQIAAVSVQAVDDPSRNYNIQKISKDYALTNTISQTKVSPYDTAALYSYLDGFKNVNYEADLSYEYTPQQVDSIVSVAPPLYKLSVQTTYGKQLVIQTYKMPNAKTELGEPIEYSQDRMYALLDGKLLMMQSMSFDRLVRPIDFFYAP